MHVTSTSAAGTKSDVLSSIQAYNTLLRLAKPVLKQVTNWPGGDASTPKPAHYLEHCSKRLPPVVTHIYIHINVTGYNSMWERMLLM